MQEPLFILFVFLYLQEELSSESAETSPVTAQPTSSVQPSEEQGADEAAGNVTETTVLSQETKPNYGADGAIVLPES